MFLSLSTRTWHDRSLPEALAAARATGIRALELGATPDCPHLRPSAGPRCPELLRPILRDEWRIVAATADHPDLPRDREEGANEAVDHVSSAVKCAAALGAGVVSVSLGGTEVDAWETAWNRALVSLRRVLGKTARTRAKVAVEIHADDVLNSLKKARRLLQEIEDPRLGLTFDTALLYYLRIDLKEALAVAGDRLYHVHLRDATRSDYSRAIGRGEVNFPATFRALREHGYTGALSLELHPLAEPSGPSADEAVAEAVPRLQEWLQR